MENLQKEIEKILILKLSFSKDDWSLTIAADVAKMVGEVDDPKEAAEQIFRNILTDDTIPPEIMGNGFEAVLKYINYFGYNTTRGMFLKAAQKINKKISNKSGLFNS